MRQITIGQYLLSGCAVAVALIAYLLSSGKIADHDPFVMGEVAQHLTEGKSLYLETWDNKPPLAILFYYPSQAIAPQSYLGQQIFTFLWNLAWAVVVFLLLHGEKPWIRIVIAVAVLWMPLSRTDFAWGSSEDAVNGFTILLSVLGYRVLRDGRLDWRLWLACGAAAGFAVHTRQCGVVFLGFPIAALLFSPVRRHAKSQALGLTAIGCFIAFALVIGVVLIIGGWSSYLDIMFNKPLQYSGVQSIVSGHHGIGGLDEHSAEINSWEALLSEKLLVIRSVLLNHFSILAKDILLLVPILAVFFVSGRRWKLMTLMLLLTGIAAVLLPMKLFSHYHQQMIPTFAICTLLLLRRIDEVSPRVAKSMAVGMLGFIFLNVVTTTEALRVDDGEQAEMEEVVRIIESEGGEKDTLFAVGQNSAYIYYRSTMEPCHKIHWEHFFGWLSVYLPVDIETVMDSIARQPPNWIAIDRDSHETFLLRPEAEEEGIVRTGELLRRLIKQYSYQTTHQIGRWLIFQRE